MLKVLRKSVIVPLIGAFTMTFAGTGSAAYQTDKNGKTLTAEQISQLDALKDVTSKYTNVNQAITDGYVPVGDCVPAELVGLPPETGTMGIHYFNPNFVNLNPAEGITLADVLDPAKPELLLYTRDQDGNLQLAGAEYMIAYEEWIKIHPELANVSREEMRDNAENYPRPQISGFEFEGLMENHDAYLPKEQQQEPWHFDKHIWVHSDNASGVDAQWNPNITCHALSNTGSGSEGHEHEVPNTGSNAGGNEVPNTGSNAGGNEVPNTGSNAGGNEVPNTGSNAGGNEVPNTGSNAGGNEVSNTASGTEGNKIVNTGSSTEGNKLVNTGSSTEGNKLVNTASKPEGKALPNTASNSYNWLMLGSILLAVGSVFYFIQRRKSTI